MNIKTTVLSIGMSLLFGQSIEAQKGRPAFDQATESAISLCKDKLPARDSGTRPTQEKFESFKACVEANGGKLPGGRGRPKH